MRLRSIANPALAGDTRRSPANAGKASPDAITASALRRSIAPSFIVSVLYPWLEDDVQQHIEPHLMALSSDALVDSFHRSDDVENQ
jgi:hypothetical protein